MLNLRLIRENCQITQTQMAKDLGVTQAYISQIENNDKIGVVEFYVKLKTIYNISENIIIELMKCNCENYTKKQENI